MVTRRAFGVLGSMGLGLTGLGMTAALTGCAHAPAGAPPVFDAAGRPVAPGALLARLRAARFVLLGEVHDNAAQHRARAELLRALLADGRPTRVVFEQIDREHGAAIAALPPAQARDVDAVVAAGRLDRAGWAWPLHRPLFDAALAGGATVVGGNLSRADATQLVRGGAARLPADLQRWFGDGNGKGRDSSWTEAQAETMRREVDEGHCKALPASMLEPMALAQRARDAALAEAMLAAPVAAPVPARVVLIAGNGHVRGDIGVPHYLRAAGVEGRDIVAFGFVETALPGGGGGYDYVGVTEAVQRADPCAGFKPK